MLTRSFLALRSIASSSRTTETTATSTLLYLAHVGCLKDDLRYRSSLNPRRPAGDAVSRWLTFASSFVTISRSCLAVEKITQVAPPCLDLNRTVLRLNRFQLINLLRTKNGVGWPLFSPLSFSLDRREIQIRRPSSVVGKSGQASLSYARLCMYVKKCD